MGWMDEYNKLKKKRNETESKETPTSSSKPAATTQASSGGSWMDEYNALKQKREEKKENISDKVITRATTKKDEDEDKKWYQGYLQKGAFEDGYDFGDISKTILGTLGDVGENLISGVAGMGEKVIDATALLAPAMNEAYQAQNSLTHRFDAEQYNKDLEQAKKFIQKDLYDEEKVAKAIIDPGMNLLGVSTEEDSVFGEKSDALVQSGGQLLATAGLQAVGVPWWVTSGTTSFGGSMEEKLNDGATIKEAVFSSAISAGAEILSEKLSGGISFGGKTLDEGLTKLLARGISNKAARVLAKLGVDMAGEGFEEVFSQVADNLGTSLYKEESLKELLFSEEAFDEYVESFIGGAVLGGVGSGVQAVKANSKGVDYVSEMTANEQKVVDKLYKDRVAEAEKEGKVSQKEKGRIYDEVVEEMEKGYIDTSTIEEILGGDSLKSFRDLQQEADEYKTLYETESGKLSERQKDRLAELKEKNKANPYETAVKNARAKISEDVFTLTKGDRLTESYNERARRGQKYEADLTKYDKKQQATIQKAIDSGILNNSRRTHEFVDFVAKISADTGTPFEFADNAKIKESGFAMEGQTVDGFYHNGSITVNIDSPKSRRFVVGHEITHALEGTELYDTLRKTVFDYAKMKNQYGVRMESIQKRYKEGTDFESELTADLVGEYIFSDVDFVNHLSVQDRNLFQRVFDEIKYLCKVATAGSKEARELEKVKRVFEKAYREAADISPEAREFSDADTKYSIREEAPPKKTIEGYKVFMVKDGKLYPPMVANPEGEGTPVGVWLNADVGGLAYDADGNVQLNTKGRFKVKAGGKGTQGGSGELAFRPGWHLGEYPDASQFGRENKERLVTNKKGEMVHPKELFPYDFVWARCEVAADHDYQLDAMSFGVNKKGKFERSQAGLPYIPEDGYYKYRTNANPDTAPWIISGAIKVVEILDDEQVARICAEHGVTPQQRQGYEIGAKSVKGIAKPGNKIDLSMFGLQAGQVTPTAAEVLEQIRQTEGTAAERKAQAMEILKTLPGYAKRQIDFDDANIIKEFSMNHQSVEDYRRMAEESGHGYLIDDKIYTEAPKYSLSDSDGRQLTKEQQDYFKDSKVRDENGNLKVMYHGSQDAGFHTFDSSMSDDGTSFFFVDRNDVAASYSGTYETYEAKAFKTPEDANRFFESIGKGEYEVVEKDGSYALLDDGDEIATGSLDELYKEFCDYEGVGYGDANYKVYLNLKNPLEVDAEGRNWDNVSREFWPELYEQWKTEFTQEEKDALVDLAGWEDYATFKNEVERAVRDAGKWTADEHTKAIDSAYWKNSDISSLFSMAVDNFSDEVLKAEAVKQLTTRDYAQRAKEQGYDGVIFRNIVDNGGYSNGSEGASTVAIAFDSNQIKSVANEKPTADPDIRYSLSDVTEEQNQKGLNTRDEVSFSLSRDTEYMDKAIAMNQKSMSIDTQMMEETKALRERIAARMNAIKDRGLVGLPEDIEGNTYIANSSYDGTEENTTICPRSLASEAFVDAVSEYLGRPLTVNEQIYISQDLQGRSLTPECTYCYVATDRKAYRAFLGEYVAQRDAVLQKVQENPNADVSRSGDLYKEFLNGRKDTNPMYSRFKMWVDAYKNGKPMIDASHLANINKLMGDINSEFGAELKPQIVDAMKYAQSASWAKKRVNYVAYNGHILKWKQDRINKLNSHYGLRMYSFSDFHPAFVLENMQMITDASVRGLKMLGYTKDTDFVEIFAPSGMNINVSTFGFDVSGEVFENNLIGAEWEKAKALREQYPNVGVTFVATNDTLVDWALNQDWIDVVIPFHLVRTGREVAKAFNYHDYTSESSDTKTKDWKKGDKKYIAPTEHNNDKATYLAALEKNHLKPRFERFIDRANYMKLVNECRQPASKSQPVQPKFNEDAAMVALAKLEANGYYQPVGGSVDRMYEIAGEVAEAMTSQIAPAMSLSEYGEKHTSDSLSALKLEAPVAENATTTENASTVAENAMVAPTVSDMESVREMFPDDGESHELEDLISEEEEIRGVMEAYAGVGDIDAVNKLIPEHEAIQARIKELQQPEVDRADSLTDADVPPEMDAPLSMRSENYDPFADVGLHEISRSTKSYSDRNPGARRFLEDAALGFLYDVNNSIQGERWYNDQLYYESGGEKGFGGTKRVTTEDIADLKDTYGYTWDELRKAAERVADGDFRSVAAKRVEYLCHKRMMEGYTDVDGRPIPANEEYISFLNETFANEQRAGGIDNLLENADQYAPEDIAPVLKPTTPDTQTAPIFESKDPNAVKGQTTMFEEQKKAPVGGKTANVLTEEPKTQKKRSRFWSLVKDKVLDKGMVFEDLSKETGNREIEAKWNYIRYSRSRAQRLIGNGTDGVKSLKSIKETVEKSGKTKQFSDYLYHKHNVDRMSLEDRFYNTPNKAVFGDSVTSEMSQRKAEQYEKQNPEFLSWAEDVYGYMNHLRSLLVENDVISQETADLWEKMYPHYVPIRRAGVDGLNINVPLDSRRTTVNNPIKRAQGGNQDILPLFETMAQRTTQTYRAIARNSFGIELKNQLGTEVEKTPPAVDDVIDGIERDDALLKPGEFGGKPTFTVFENGEKVEFEITEDMYEAMKPTSEALQYRNKLLGGASSVFRGLTTQYSIPFMATNAIKDAQDVLINSQHPVKTYANFPRAWYEQVTRGKYYQEYMENGGEDNTYFDVQKSSFDEGNWFKKGFDTITKPVTFMNDFIEKTPRLAEYIASREAGRSIEVSMLDSARVTTNFAAGGDLTKFLNRNGATFLNASVQGAVQQARNVREAHQKGLMGYVGLAARTIVAGLPAVLLNNLLWDDDEEYEELADYVKQDYYIVGKYDDGKFIRIPKGRTVAVIQNAIEQVQNAATGDGEVDLAAFLQLAVNNLAPNNPLENNILAPALQAWNNETWYGEELVPSRLQDLPAAEQFDEKTDSFSKKLGETFNISPYKINYLLNQYSGGLGDVILPMMTPRAESGDDSLLGVFTAPLRDKFTTDSVINSQVVSDFYDMKDELQVKANSSKATEEDYFRDLYMDTVGYELSDLYAQKREIQNSDMTDAEKYNRSREIQEQIVDRMKRSLDVYNNIQTSGVYAEVGDKRFNQDADSGKWYEIQEKNSDGSDNWYYQKEQEVTKALGISYEQYWNNREEYNYAYDKPEQYALAQAVGGYTSYKSYSGELWDIKADKDENGKSISGSRKEKVIDYINGLDADYGEKIILFKNEYNADDTYNYDIIEYLNGRDDISYQQMETILKYLGFEVDSNGNISW